MKKIHDQILKLLKLETKTAFIMLIILDIVCIGMGMGVPFFNIVFGFFVGWYLVNQLSFSKIEVKDILRHLLKRACIISTVTFAGMVLIWGWSILLLRGSDTEIENFGIPMILFLPRASLIGWIILMVFISPFLQLLTAIFAGNLTLLYNGALRTNKVR